MAPIANLCPAAHFGPYPWPPTEKLHYREYRHRNTNREEKRARCQNRDKLRAGHEADKPDDQKQPEPPDCVPSSLQPLPQRLRHVGREGRQYQNTKRDIDGQERAKAGNQDGRHREADSAFDQPGKQSDQKHQQNASRAEVSDQFHRLPFLSVLPLRRAARIDKPSWRENVILPTARLAFLLLKYKKMRPCVFKLRCICKVIIHDKTKFKGEFMPHDGQDAGIAMTQNPILPDLLVLTGAAVEPLINLLEKAKSSLRALVTDGDRISGALLEQNQHAAHALSWLATYVESLTQMQHWAERLETDGCFGEMEQLIHQIAFGEYLWQIYGGIPMSQGEIARLQDIGLSQDDQRLLMTPEIMTLSQSGNSNAARMRLAALMQDNHGHATFGASGLDEELEMIRAQFRRFADDRVVPNAHDWHLKDDLIPMEIIEELAEMGVFGLTIPEDHGGFGLSKASMVVVSEELSRGYIGVGSLGTRSEIAAELILCGGTEEQKAQWLPKIASAEILPTAVFTEPNTGSDLGSLRTRAVKDGDDYTVTGNKTWITHAARTHVMTLLARTDPDTTDYRGLSMFLAEKNAGHGKRPVSDRRHVGWRDRSARLSRHEGIRTGL